VEAQLFSNQFNNQSIMRDLLPKKDVLELLAQQQQFHDPLERSLPQLVKLCSDFGKYLRLLPYDLATLEAGAYLHDIGNLFVDTSILQQSGRLNYAQWSAIRQHTIAGKRLLEDFASFQPILEIVELHHERINGTGYPHSLEGAEIPYLVQVFSICDCWHALLSERSYRAAKTVEQALAAIKQEVSMNSIDAALASTFFEFLTLSISAEIAKEDLC
jgi:HD-GYP domain-containing protein (c-di-GMP phosphodiesterase class II)